MQKRIYLSVFILLLAIMPVKSQTSVQGQIDSIMTIYPNCMDYPMDVLMTLDSLFQVLDSQQASDDGKSRSRRSRSRSRPRPRRCD